MASLQPGIPERGFLRIYLGAAAGVGKTFAMLGEGHRRAERGADVVVAFVETHGRPQTAALLDELEVIPRKKISYRGATFEEMDLDAVLARHPQIALVDELAHTNVPGSRHEKRWQDVDELLDAGIDVISTVNVQHLESLNDVVQKITGVPQRETIPDAVVRAADQVELVDMTAEITSMPASSSSATSCQRLEFRDPGTLVCASSSTSAICGLRASTASTSISSKDAPRYSRRFLGTTSSPSIWAAVCGRPCVSANATTTSAPRSSRRCPSESMANVLPTPAAAPR